WFCRSDRICDNSRRAIRWLKTESLRCDVGSLNPPTNLQGKPLLRWLLSRRNQFPHEISQIDERIIQEFAQNVAVLVLDMVGFSRLTIKYGIIHYLAMIEQMDDAARPAIVGNNGRVIKQEADNIFAIFNSPVDAVEAALDIFRAL